MAVVRQPERPVPGRAEADRCEEPGGTGGAAPWRRQLQLLAGRGADLCVDRAFTFPLGWDLEEERRALKEDQKLCRSRARKYLVETNRRRRAFEERQKQKEEKEERFREQVLQQKKIKSWETTEKFLHAHLPASQHKQIVQTNAAFQLEEALAEIKGSVLTSGLCLPSINKTTFRTTDGNAYSPVSRNGYLRQEQISAMVGLDKTTQESSRTSVDSNRLLFQRKVKEMQQLIEKQHLSSLENFHKGVKQTDGSESLSSLDSLEAGGQNGNYTPSSESSLTTSRDRAPVTPGKSQTTSNDMCLNNGQRNSDSRNNQHHLPTRDLLAKLNALTLAKHTSYTEEEPLVSHRSRKKVAEFSVSGNQESSVNKAFPFLQNIKEERNNSSSGAASTLTAGHSVFSPIKACASPVPPIPGERVQDVTQNQSFKMTPQKRSKPLQTSTEPTATSGILFPNQRCSSGISIPADLMPKDRNGSRDFFKYTLGKVIETKEENIKSIDDTDQGSSLLPGIPNASALCNVKKQNNKEEDKANVAETKLVVSDTELGFVTPEQHNSQKNNTCDRRRAKLVRSIVKNEAEAVVMNDRITFGTRPVSSIRDSLELAKCKKKSAENMKYGRKLKKEMMRRMLAPRPPSAPALGSKHGKTRASPAARRPLPSSHPQDTTANGNSLNERKALLADQTLNKNTPGNSESRTCSSQAFTMPSTPRCSMSCEPLAKRSGSVSHGPTRGCQDCSVTCTEQRASTKNRIHLDRIPTAEETSARKGAYIARTPKDPAAGVTQHHLSHYNNSCKTKCQPSKAPVSRIPAGDSSHKTCFKAPSRTNELGFFHANSVVPVTKQRQILNNCENKHRAFTEHRRQTAPSKRWKPIHTQNLLHTVQLSPVQTASEPAQSMNNSCKSEEVSESTAQFLMAEKLISTAATEDEILAAMEGVQPGRQPLLHSTAPRLGMSALSIEEEKITQSLDRLNQRLQNVQEAITRNPSASGILQLLAAFVKY
ncbi:centrosomal protein of 126 kDa [Cyrtonyx montezumae]|uniref:centrosomal protein of 126 kDa n=1 Tax=Cyrtonyx montezumae TaxID=9017 RepID=UPI0032DBAD11